jgi:hypothetical protein
MDVIRQVLGQLLQYLLYVSDYRLVIAVLELELQVLRLVVKVPDEHFDLG